MIYYTQADGYFIRLVSNISNLEDYFTSFTTVLNKLSISFILLNQFDDNLVDGQITFYDSEEFSIIFDSKENNLFVSCPWKRVCDSTFLAMVYRFYIEYIRQIHFEIKLHASSITDGKNTVLFMAPSEGGKTTTAMAMCQKMEYSFCSNDAAVTKYINGAPILLRGDCIFNVRMNGLKAYSSNLMESVQQQEMGETNPWNKKTNISPDEIGVRIGTLPQRITHIFFVKLDVLTEDPIVTPYYAKVPDKKKNWFKNKMQVFQNIGGTIRGSDFFPSGNGGEILPISIPSLDNNALSLYRNKFLCQLFEDCKIWEVRGTLDCVLENVNKIIRDTAFTV